MQCNILVGIAILLRVTDKESLSEIVQYDPLYIESFHCF